MRRMPGAARRHVVAAAVGLASALTFGTMRPMVSQARPDDVLALVGARLRAARAVIDAELQSKDMAAALGVAPNTYAQWEAGARLADPLAMARLADIFGIGLDWVYRGRLDCVPRAFARALLREFPHLVGPRRGPDGLDGSA